MITSPSASPLGVARTVSYVPGFAFAKLAMAALGLALVLLGINRFMPVIRALSAGGSTRAEAVRVVRINANGKETVLTSESAITAAIEDAKIARDRESVLVVEYRFALSTGQPTEARSPISVRVLPVGEDPKNRRLLRDQDGLPCSTLVWYDPTNPKVIIQPLYLSTWFLPGAMIFFGAICLGMGLMLWWYAKKPVDMPDFSRGSEPPEPAGNTTPP